MYPLKRHDHLRSTQRRRMKTYPACCVNEEANITNAASKDISDIGRFTRVITNLLEHLDGLKDNTNEQELEILSNDILEHQKKVERLRDKLQQWQSLHEATVARMADLTK